MPSHIKTKSVCLYCLFAAVVSDTPKIGQNDNRNCSSPHDLHQLHHCRQVGPECGENASRTPVKSDCDVFSGTDGWGWDWEEHGVQHVQGAGGPCH